jgi:hypothetical protein
MPNRDLNVGKIISLTDNAQPIANLLHVDEATLRTVLNGWGPGNLPPFYSWMAKRCVQMELLPPILFPLRSD